MTATTQLGKTAVHVRPASHDSVSPEQLAEQVRAALEKPLGYPSLSEATVPGDQVVVTLQHGLPMAGQLLTGLGAALRDAGVEPSRAMVLLSDQAASELDRLADQSGLRAERHDPAVADDCAYVGLTPSDQPLRINRQLSNADIVLPVGLAVVGLDDEPCEKYCGLFPHYCDQATIARHRDGREFGTGKFRRDRLREIDESGWLLGVGLTLQVVPGPGGAVAAVLAGEPNAVARAATEEYRKLWSQTVATRGDLVIATITGATVEQSWDDFARALTAAESVLRPGGAIAICSQLADAPGPSLGRLAGGSGYAELERALRNDKFADTQTALRLCQALERGPIYLQSQLDAEVVENLGLAPIGSDTELSRLAESYRRPLLLEDAHRLLPRLSE